MSWLEGLYAAEVCQVRCCRCGSRSHGDCRDDPCDGFLRTNGAATVTTTFVVQPTSRFNVSVGPGTEVLEWTDEEFGALITSDQPIAVERALYWDANGQIWAAGTNATATRLP